MLKIRGRDEPEVGCEVFRLAGDLTFIVGGRLALVTDEGEVVSVIRTQGSDQ